MTDKIDKTLKERGSRYGSFKDNAEITQILMEVILEAPNFDQLSRQHKEAIHMIFHKIARCVCGDINYPDNFHDIAGYAKLLEEFLIENNSHEKNKSEINKIEQFFCERYEDFSKHINEAINEEILKNEIIFLEHCLKGKFGENIDVSEYVSDEAIEIFKQKIRTGEI